MTEELRMVAELALPHEEAESLRQQLANGGIEVEVLGADRGASEAMQLIAVVLPSLGAMALLFEKLRRLRLPRTYVRPMGDALEIWTDGETADGRFFVVEQDGTVQELPDQALDAHRLRQLFLRR